MFPRLAVLLIVMASISWFGYNQVFADTECLHLFFSQTNKLVYKPGDNVVMTIKSSIANCEPKDAPFTLRIFDITNNAQGDVVYNKTFHYSPGGMILNWTLPQESLLPIFQKYVIKTKANGPGGPTEGEEYIFVKENAPDQKYNFEIWPDRSEITLGDTGFIVARICPVPSTDAGRQAIVDKKTGEIKDPGSEVLINFYFTAPNGTKIRIHDSINSDASCYDSGAGGMLQSETVGTWSVYAVAQWIEHNTTRTMQSNSTTFVIKEPLTTSLEAKKIFDLETTNQTHVSMSDIKQGKYSYNYGAIDWSPDGKSILATIGVNESSQFWLIDPQTKESQTIDLPVSIQGVSNPRISPSGNSIIFVGRHQINQNNSVNDLFRYDIKDQKFVQITNDTVNHIESAALWTPDGNIIYSESEGLSDFSPTKLWLADSNGNKIKKIYEEPRRFFMFDISKDGKKMLISDKRVLDMDTLKTTVIENLQSGLTGGARFTPSQSLFTYSPSGGYGIGGYVYLQSTDGYGQILYYSKDPTPSSPVMSPDGRFVAFASNYGSSDTVKGIYLVELTKPIPEFPFAIPVLLISIISIIAFYRMKFRK